MDVTTIDDSKRNIIRRLLLKHPAFSDHHIAWIVDCDTKVVSQIRRALLDAGELHRHEVDESKSVDV